ncbi:Choloylglycine hydrolase [Rhodopirellula baltica SWK14]|uniref:Choloylglycine hydrolase n=2 Tax=Rhodopirellula baltica TaxID=265606 RepID=L7CCU9_RHOBT|nr:linear amide C-N hydrolase [Rhodopirellula baltica]ELP32014.1 Choloylglycine hydrolase [Rhodopirellula baltica SWK14]
MNLRTGRLTTATTFALVAAHSLPEFTHMRLRRNSHPARRIHSFTGVGLVLQAAMVGVLAITAIQPATACTVMRMTIHGKLVIARNHDWPFGEALVITNLRGIEKTSLAPIKPATWVSKYGSVSFCQFGREIPFAGMNEKGLTVDLLHLPGATFPDPVAVEADPNLTAVNAIQWVQYQLDTAETVAEVVDSLSTVVPIPMLPMVETVHYFVTDSTGDVAVVEFINGSAVVRHGDDYRLDDGKPKIHACVLANSSWEDSQTELQNNSSRMRYGRGVRLVEMANEIGVEIAPIDYAIRCLRMVAQGPLTQWNLVYQPEERRIHFRTQNSQQRRWIDLDDLSFEPEQTPQAIDIDRNINGNVVPHMKAVTDADNERIVNHAFDHFVPAGLPSLMIKQLLLDYPSKLRSPQTAP